MDRKTCATSQTGLTEHTVTEGCPLKASLKGACVSISYILCWNLA